jgi:hypothetical protein
MRWFGPERAPGDLTNISGMTFRAASLVARTDLAFEAVDQCVASVRRLSDDTDLRVSTLKAIHEYHLRNVRPDVIASRSPGVALGSQ